MLLKINERKRWSDPPPSDPERKAAQDEEIFQTARLVNCGHFMAMIFGDYVAVSTALICTNSIMMSSPSYLLEYVIRRANHI